MSTLIKAIDGFSLGEGPHWDVTSGNLYFVDVFQNAIVRYTPTTNKTVFLPSFIIPVEDKPNEFITSQDNELVVISWDGESDKVLVKEKLCAVADSDLSKSFNDAKCDSSGRLWIGAHSVNTADFLSTKPLGFLFTFNVTKRQLTAQVDKIRISNGLAFNDQTKKMFYIDSLIRSVDRFDFEIENGTVTNREVWFSFDAHNIQGVPDGMTIDTDGNLWVAACGGCCVVKIDGDKKESLLDTVKIPAEQVTSVAFGGENLDELYVTTGNMDWGVKKPISENGATYRVLGTGAKGLPAANFKY